MQTNKIGAYATNAASKAVLLSNADASHPEFSKDVASTATVVPATDTYERGRSPTPRHLPYFLRFKPSSSFGFCNATTVTGLQPSAAIPIPQKP